jgi:NAD(P)-dependent dehydrogenase (short-subunit alcohol dehydrogenase family)
MTAYAQSKKANRMLTWDLAERLRGKTTANAVHPGFVASELNRNERGLRGIAVGIAHLLFARSTEKGAEGATWLASSPEAASVTGKFWKDKGELTCKYRDPGKMRSLFELCEKQTASPWR